MTTTRKVTPYQVMLLILVYRITIAFSYLPAVNTPPANQDVWIMLLLAIPYTIVICFPILFLSNKFKDLTLIEYMEKIFGKVLGKIIGFYYTVFFIIFTIFLVSVLVEILDTTMFPETPTWATLLMMLITCTYVAYKGLETMCRGAEIFVPFILVVIFLLSILGIKNLDFSVLLPMFSDSTFKQINKGAIDISLKFLDIIVLAMITPHLDRREKLNNIFYKSLIFSTVTIIVIVIVSQAALGIQQVKHATFPFFTFARLINLYDFIQRIESIFVVAWIMCNIGKITGYLYFSTVSLAQILEEEDNKPYIIPLAVIVFIVTVIIKDNRSLVGTQNYLEKIVLIFSLMSIVIIPSIALIVYFFRRKSIETSDIN